MKVKFKNTFFASSPAQQPNKLQTISGKRYKKGQVYDLPESAREWLPSSVTYLDDDEPADEVVPETLAEADALRANAEAVPDDSGEKRGRGRPRKDADA